MSEIKELIHNIKELKEVLQEVIKRLPQQKDYRNYVPGPPG